MTRLNYVNRKSAGLKLGQIVQKDLVRSPGAIEVQLLMFIINAEQTTHCFFLEI